MIMKRQLGEKGQVVIPIDIRQMLSLHSGENVVFEVKDEEVKIKKEQNPDEFLRDFLDTMKDILAIKYYDLTKKYN